MTATDRHRVAGPLALAAGAVAVSGLLGGCAAEQDRPTGPVERNVVPATVTDPCPADLTAGQLTGSVDLGAADIDGDGAADEVVMGSVPVGGRGCVVAVVVTTADGTAAAPVDGASAPVAGSPLGPPVYAQVDGAAGDEIVVTTSWSPRGGGQLGMFSWVDGALVAVRQAKRPWSLFATVDDGGGTPQLLSCVDGGFAEVSAYPPGLDTGSTVTTYTLNRGELTVSDRTQDRGASYQRIRSRYPDLPRAGLAVFPDCR